jgi:hypothetical protein
MRDETGRGVELTKPPQMKKTLLPRFALPGPALTMYGVAYAIAHCGGVSMCHRCGSQTRDHQVSSGILVMGDRKHHPSFHQREHSHSEAS